MIENLSIWAEQIIVAVIIATLIEMILPNGNNKKYIKAVIGVYLLFTIISPIFGKNNFNFNEVDYEKYFKDTKSYQTMSDSLTSYNDQSVEEIYLTNLKQDMKQKLKEKGYLVKEIGIKLNLEEGKNYGRINEIRLQVSKIKEEEKEEKKTSNININTVDKITIGNTITNEIEDTTQNETISSNEEAKLKEYLSSVYEVASKNIQINKNT